MIEKNREGKSKLSFNTIFDSIWAFQEDGSNILDLQVRSIL